MWDDNDEDPNWTHGLPFEGSAYTYIEIISSPLSPILIKGGLSYVTRGYGQYLKLEPSVYSYDPDNPDDKVSYLNYLFSYLNTTL